AADALRLPGVTVDRGLLEDAGIEPTATDALLRQAALAPLTEIVVESEEHRPDGHYEVTVSYAASSHHATTTFDIVQDGWTGVVPNWRFATSPLAEVELTVRGADQFAVNGFEVDRRQVSIDASQAQPLDP